MEFFENARFVRLWSRVRGGVYLVADEDAAGVSLDSRRASLNAVWAVQVGELQGEPAVLLRGAAYGRYLAATELLAPFRTLDAVRARQVGVEDHPPARCVMWLPGRTQGGVQLRNHTGRFLRANGRHLWWCRAVTVGAYNGSAMMQWAVEVVPLRPQRPSIDSILRPPPGGTSRHGLLRRREPQVSRQIQYVQADANGDVDEGAWDTMQFNGRSVLLLSVALAVCSANCSAEVLHRTVCVRAGRYGRLIPLLTNLPRVPAHAGAASLTGDEDDEHKILTNTIDWCGSKNSAFSGLFYR